MSSILFHSFQVLNYAYTTSSVDLHENEREKHSSLSVGLITGLSFEVCGTARQRKILRLKQLNQRDSHPLEIILLTDLRIYEKVELIADFYRMFS